MSDAQIETGYYTYAQLLDFAGQDTLTHRHLDWLTLGERLGQPYVFTLREGNELEAMLSTTPDVPAAAWLRFFDCRRDYPHGRAFNQLTEAARKALAAEGIPNLFSLSFADWFTHLLERNGFEKTDEVLSLAMEPPRMPAPDLPEGFALRQIRQADLPAVQALDTLAFSPEWQHSQRSLLVNYQNQGYATILMRGEEVVGYQLSTASYQGMHLNRLAVAPAFQGKGLGSLLVQDLMAQAEDWAVNLLSVNTQRSNPASQRLYARLGFTTQGAPIPVYQTSI